MSVLECADMIQTEKGQQHPEPVMTFLDEFVSRSAILQNPDHRLTLGKTRQEADLAPDSWPDS